MNDVTTLPRATARELLAEAIRMLASAGIDDPRFEASVMLAHSAEASRAHVVSASFVPDDAVLARFHANLGRRVAREPLAYILGRKEFFSLEFEVTPAVLIPRPETETLVETALAIVGASPRARVLELGTGSGAVAVTIALNARDVQLVATDVSNDALLVARQNARRHDVGDSIEFLQGSWFEALAGAPRPLPFDLIVSNPPYVPEGALAALAPEVARFEPRSALAGGLDGLDSYRAIAASVSHWLAPDGELLLEVGAGQDSQVAGILDHAGLAATRVINDLAGIARVVRARCRGA